MPAVDILFTIILFILLTASCISIIFGIPGNFLSFGVMLIYGFVTGWNYIGWMTLLVVFLLAVSGEVIEYYLGVKYARRGGLSKKGIVASLIGAIAGAIIFAPFLLGAGAIIGTAVGAFVGAFVASAIEQKSAGDAISGGIMAAIGRMKGILIKGFIGLLIIITAVISVLA